MKNVQVGWGVLVVVALVLAPLQVVANFHVVNTRAGNNFNLNVLPSNNFHCGGIQSPMVFSANYPNCHGGDINLPNGQCGWSGAKLRPACNGNYFGKVIGASDEDQGYCNWNDQGETVGFTCGSMRIYDRLVCITNMCGPGVTSENELPIIQ
jgi:hypothetical protein